MPICSGSGEMVTSGGHRARGRCFAHAGPRVVDRANRRYRSGLARMRPRWGAIATEHPVALAVEPVSARKEFRPPPTSSGEIADLQMLPQQVEGCRLFGGSRSRSPPPPPHPHPPYLEPRLEEDVSPSF